MADAVLTNQNISVEKALLGLATKYYYEPTHSEVRGYTYDYAPDMGERLAHVLSVSPEELGTTIAKCGDIVSTPIGHWHLEACLSADHSFAALQLFRFVDFSNTPVSSVKIYEGEAARQIAGLIA